jgi:hypothetical protein
MLNSCRRGCEVGCGVVWLSYFDGLTLEDEGNEANPTLTLSPNPYW